MSKNLVQLDADHQSLVVTDPASPVAGNPVRINLQTGVATTDMGAANSGNAATYTSVDVGHRIWSLSVKGVDDNGSSAVADGDPIYYVDADTPKLSKKSTGYFFGFARGTVTGNATATIHVEHVHSPASGTVGAGSVNATALGTSAVTTTKIASNAVTAAKLTTTMAKGYVNLPLSSFRLLASNDVPNSGSADGGIVSKNTDPVMEAINGATDIGLRIKWAATSVIPIVAQFEYPPDLDDAATVTVSLVLYKDANANATMTLGVAYFEGIGDTNAGGNTAAITETAAAQKTVVIAASDVGPYPATATIKLTPGTHANDALYLMGVSVEYTRR